MQHNLLEEPPREFFKPTSFGSHSSHYKHSTDGAFFNAFKNGFSNNHLNTFGRDENTSSSSININFKYRRHSPRSVEATDGIAVVENSYEHASRPSDFRLRKEFPSYDDRKQSQSDILDATERYVAFGEGPLVRHEVYLDAGSPHNPTEFHRQRDKYNHKGGYRDSRGLFIFTWVLIFFFTALCALSIGLGLHYGLTGTQTFSNIQNNQSTSNSTIGHQETSTLPDHTSTALQSGSSTMVTSTVYHTTGLPSSVLTSGIHATPSSSEPSQSHSTLETRAISPSTSAVTKQEQVANTTSATNASIS